MNHANGRDVRHTAPEQPASWYPRLLRLLDEQLALAGRLEAWAARQRAHVASGDLPGILGDLEAREPLVVELTRRAEEIEPFVRDARGPASVLDATQRHEVQERLTGIEERLEAVNRLDAQDERALLAMKDALAAEIANLRVGRAALGAYAAVDEPSGAVGGRLA